MHMKILKMIVTANEKYCRLTFNQWLKMILKKLKKLKVGTTTVLSGHGRLTVALHRIVFGCRFWKLLI